MFDTRRDWGSPWIPERLDLPAMLRHVPQVAVRPVYLARWFRSGSLPDLGVPNSAARDAQVPSFFGAYGQWMGSAPASWEDLAWLREQWDGPFMIKGITRPDDARRAADIGATAISVSNHGGNNLDSTPATIRCLPAVADAVGDRIEVLLDGGIRRGSDVVKALALGARAVMIGRPYLWGLAANGERGVSNVLEILRQGISETLYGLGQASVHDLTRDDVIVPDGFTLGQKPDRGPPAAAASQQEEPEEQHRTTARRCPDRPAPGAPGRPGGAEPGPDTGRTRASGRRQAGPPPAAGEPGQERPRGRGDAATVSPSPWLARPITSNASTQQASATSLRPARMRSG